MAGDWGESGEGVDDALTRAIIDANAIHQAPFLEAGVIRGVDSAFGP